LDDQGRVVLAPETVEGLGADAHLARQKGYRFDVYTKERHQAPWILFDADIDDLVEAVEVARGLNAWETGVMMDGSIYWTSRNPDLLNTTVMTIPRSR
jgi:hypothetical protein